MSSQVLYTPIMPSGHQLQSHLSLIPHTKGTQESAKADANAHIAAIGTALLGLCLKLVIVGLQHLQKLFVKMRLVGAVVDGGVALPCQILIAELQGSMPAFSASISISASEKVYT